MLRGLHHWVGVIPGSRYRAAFHAHVPPSIMPAEHELLVRFDIAGRRNESSVFAKGQCIAALQGREW